ncbi:hypothetical protein F511_19549 [Dorcoceras hygrometricum]|uniref:Uncharacterized protein n=1 Tax=Dorcoceras hygrometricum TaxID=472368 RepID=A0A2Z7D0C7_9LAMI|nr:hypothetical protein F511_19549 [Dorcoceras hygrometricum]
MAQYQILARKPLRPSGTGPKIQGVKKQRRNVVSGTPDGCRMAAPAARAACDSYSADVRRLQCLRSAVTVPPYLNTDLTKIKDNKNSNYKINVTETQAFDKHSHAATGSHSTTHVLRRGLTCTKKASEPRGSAGKTGSNKTPYMQAQYIRRHSLKKGIKT